MKGNLALKKLVTIPAFLLLMVALFASSSGIASAAGNNVSVLASQGHLLPSLPAKAQIAATSPTCSGNGCDHLDPFATNCAGPDADYYVVATANVVDSAGSVAGYVQLWWSATCQTNWARIVPTTYPDTFAVEAKVTTADGRSDDFKFDENSAAWTNQLYAPTVQAQAWGSIATDHGDYFGTTSWV